MTERIDAARTRATDLARLVEEYHELNRAVHRAETRLDPVSDEAEQELKRRRLALKDRIATLLAEDAAA